MIGLNRMVYVWKKRVKFTLYCPTLATVVRTLGSYTNFQSTIEFKSLSLSTVVANWLSLRTKSREEDWILKSRLKNTVSLLGLYSKWAIAE